MENLEFDSMIIKVVSGSVDMWDGRHFKSPQRHKGHPRAASLGVSNSPSHEFVKLKFPKYGTVSTG
jgi:hypothetical protein